MTRRLLAAALIVTTISVAQGSLLYAATMPSGSLPAATHDLGPAGGPALATASSVLPGAAASDISIECLRGGDFCFGYGTWNCCGELFALMAISSAVAAWAAAGVSAFAYWYYC